MHCTVVYVHTYVCKYIHVLYKATLLSFNLRESVIGSFNSFVGHPVDKIFSQNWLQLSDTKISDTLLEAARPRTIEKHSIELVVQMDHGH